MTSTVAGVHFPIITPGLRHPQLGRAEGTATSPPTVPIPTDYALLGSLECDSPKGSERLPQLKYNDQWHSPVKMPGLRHPMVEANGNAPVLHAKRSVQTGVSAPGIRNPVVEPSSPTLESAPEPVLPYQMLRDATFAACAQMHSPPASPQHSPSSRPSAPGIRRPMLV